MNYETIHQEVKKIPALQSKKEYMLLGSILLSAVILAGAWAYDTSKKTNIPQEVNAPQQQETSQISVLMETVLPPDGVTLPITWGDLGLKLVR